MWTEERKLKMREIQKQNGLNNKGRKRTVEQNEANRIRNIGSGNGMYGKKQNEKTILALKAARKLQIGKNSPNYGNYWTQEQKDNVSKKLKGRKHYNNSIKVIKCYPGTEPDGFVPGCLPGYFSKKKKDS